MEEEPVKKPSKVHEIGSDLSLLSVHELRERVEALQAEIERLAGHDAGEAGDQERRRHVLPALICGTRFRPALTID